MLPCLKKKRKESYSYKSNGSSTTIITEQPHANSPLSCACRRRPHCKDSPLWRSPPDIGQPLYLLFPKKLLEFSHGQQHSLHPRVRDSLHERTPWHSSIPPSHTPGAPKLPPDAGPGRGPAEHALREGSRGNIFL